MTVTDNTQPASLTDDQHQPWCDRAAHARHQAESLDPAPECLGREYVITLSGTEYGNYWRQFAGQNEPRFCTEWPGLHLADLTVQQVRAAFRIALNFGPSRDVDQVTNMLGDALDEYEGGDAWRLRF